MIRAERPSWGRMTMSPCAGPSFEYLPHRGEVGLRLHGTTIGQVFEAAALGLSGLQLPTGPPGGPQQTREIRMEAPDRAALLVDWLNELLYLADRDHWVPTHLDIREADETHLYAIASGPVLPEGPAEVKAATWHDLHFAPRDGAWEAEVLLDT
jgi:SHS2 domain-containing protein